MSSSFGNTRAGRENALANCMAAFGRCALGSRPGHLLTMWSGLRASCQSETPQLALVMGSSPRTRVSIRQTQLPIRLLAPTRRFCSACYSDWQVANEPARELLIWTVAAVTRCPIHDLPLQDHCHHLACRNPQPHMSSIGRTGRCFSCDESLALAPLIESHKDTSAEGDRIWQRFVADRVGQVLSVAERLRAESLPAMTNTMSVLIERTGETMSFASQTGLSKSTVAGCRYHVPTLEHLLHISSALDIAVSDLLLGNLDEHQFGWAQRRPPERAPTARSSGQRRKIDWNSIEAALELALLASDVVPQRVVMSHLGIDPSAARKRYPALCRALGDRARLARAKRTRDRRRRLRAEIRVTVATLHGQGIYPSRRQVESRLQHLSLRESELAAAWRPEDPVRHVRRAGNPIRAD